MDTQHNQTERVDNKSQDLLIDNQTSGTSSSRFSRRRFIQSGIAASPLLLSVKSPVAWGADCVTTTSAAVSGNVSSITQSTLLKSLNPESCLKVIRGNGDSNCLAIQNILSMFGITSNTKFSEIFLHKLANWNNISSSGRYEYCVSVDHSDDPTIGTALANRYFKIKLSVREKAHNGHSGGNHSHGGSHSNRVKTHGLKSGRNHNDSNNDTEVVNIEAFNLHKNLTCAYVNGILKEEGIDIDFPYTIAQITSMFEQVTSAVAELKSDSTSQEYLYSELNRILEQWD